MKVSLNNPLNDKAILEKVNNYLKIVQSEAALNYFLYLRNCTLKNIEPERNFIHLEKLFFFEQILALEISSNIL